MPEYGSAEGKQTVVLKCPLNFLRWLRRRLHSVLPKSGMVKATTERVLAQVVRCLAPYSPSQGLVTVQELES